VAGDVSVTGEPLVTVLILELQKAHVQFSGRSIVTNQQASH